MKLEYANLLLRQGLTEKALIIAESLVVKEPLNLRASNLLARVRMKLGQWDSALSLLNQAEGMSPSNPRRLVMIGDALYGKGDLNSALKSYEKAISLDADYAADAGRQVGRIKLAKGELEEAVMFFKSAVSEEEAAGFFNNAAVQAVKKNSIEEALRLYQSALLTLKTDRLKPVIYYNIALSHVKLSAKNDAITALKRALYYDPKHDKSLALLHKMQGSKAS